ncbi:hypothetical protein [Spiroplasma alleghenense]|uniref:Uncharacterized protein n=1 Tax=Spiroplasma alleghenense TaxID=216931 RepID=A0A345Z2U1_9MOLU|nr:hypothetical protein [Spiroplasma alleghenense]AXK50920.1 hypothetical protein SALLE_v1c02440 [Spiroplasma alleghenense]
MNNKTKKAALEKNYKYNRPENEVKNSKSGFDKNNKNSDKTARNGGLNLKTISIDEVIDSLRSVHNKKQFFALLGNQEEVGNEIFNIKSGAGSVNIINIEAKKVYLYNGPFSFFLKQFINHMPVVKIEDKKVLWERISVLLSALNYGKGDADFCYDFEESLDFDDPLEAIRLEFNEVFEAYAYREPLVILIRDFRGLEFEDVNSMVSFVTTIFSRVPNIKVLIEINPNLITAHYQNYISDYIQNWYTLFDGLIDCRNILEPAEFDNNETIFFEQFDDFIEKTQPMKLEEEKVREPVLAVCPPKPDWKEDEIAKEIADQLVQETVELPKKSPKIEKILNVKIPDFSVENTIEIPSESMERFEELKALESVRNKKQNIKNNQAEEETKTISKLNLGPLFGDYTMEMDDEEELPVIKEPKIARSSFLRRSDGVEQTIFDPEILMDSVNTDNGRAGFQNPFKNKK